MSLINKSIEEIIEALYNSIKNKRQILNKIKKEYNIYNDNYKEIKINRLKLVDLLDEFDMTISQSLQAIKTLKVEIFNLKEKQTTEEILNLTKELEIKHINKENNNILDKLDSNKKENSFRELKNSQNNKDNINNIENNNINDNTNNNKKNNNSFSINQIINKEIDSFINTKLNFDYSILLDNSDLSKKVTLSQLDKYVVDLEKDKLITSNSKNESKLHKNSLKKNRIIEKNKSLINNIENNNTYLKEEEIIEDQPSKLKINITLSNNDIFNKINLSENNSNNSLKQDISFLSDINNSNFIKYNNKYNSIRKDESNLNKTYNFKFNNLSNIKDLTNKKENLINLKNNTKNNQSNNNHEKSYKSNDDIIGLYKNEKKSAYIFNIKEIDREEYSLKHNFKNNFYESDNISIVSKKDILLEKVKKIEEEEKIRKLS